MLGNYASSALILSTTMLVTAILASYVILNVASTLHKRAQLQVQNLDCVISAAESGQDPSQVCDLSLLKISPSSELNMGVVSHGYHGRGHQGSSRGV